jgi:hypothetical protein
MKMVNPNHNKPANQRPCGIHRGVESGVLAAECFTIDVFNTKKAK